MSFYIPKPKYIIAVNGKDPNGKTISESNPLFVYSYDFKSNILAVTDKIWEAKTFKHEAACLDAIAELNKLSRTRRMRWTFSFHKKE